MKLFMKSSRVLRADLDPTPVNALLLKVQNMCKCFKYPIGTEGRAFRCIKALIFHSALVRMCKVVLKVASGGM